MTMVSHEVLHAVLAAVLVFTGVPLLILATRACSRRPRRAPLIAVGDARGPVFAGLTALLAFAALALGAYAARASTGEATFLSMAAALFGAIAFRTVRSARFDGIVAIPLVGLLGIAALLAIAGPQPTIDHHTHVEMSALR